MNDSARETNTRMSTLRKFAANPWVFLILGIITIASSVFAVYTWREGKASRELAVFVSSTRLDIYKKSSLSDLEISYKGEKIEADISAIELTIKNIGKLPIRAEHILENIAVSVGEGSRILEIKVIDPGRPLTGLTFSPSTSDSSQINAQWKILEQDDGAVIQVIFVRAQRDNSISVSGAVEGQKVIQSVTAPVKSEGPAFIVYRFSLITFFSASLIMLILGFLSRNQSTRRETIFHYLFGVVLLVATVVLGIIIFGLVEASTVIRR